MTENDVWQGKVAIVTGGSAGIGLATARALAQRGAQVLITGRDPGKLRKAAEQHDAIATVQVDSASVDSGQEIVQTALTLWDRIDLIVNNSGAGRPMPMEAYMISLPRGFPPARSAA
ncbi:SDR family NAD(P)-dependent oxidoreductase [Cognatishimia sp. SS12]|uniref:SDR family NAD(P)-dependent oxidoreductase n=1 Tax=Cognatishimia sp. SS12 TaxID=2979465 RepID=UPI00232FB10B|nr:SDR family NAD(P)-dependent oxidoreductase [Cognatishimia sp. SS12]MDC0737176.1 SDR family NAD(P)-dependent oxidoreductase [Cognatishimia sp. SS12]